MVNKTNRQHQSVHIKYNLSTEPERQLIAKLILPHGYILELSFLCATFTNFILVSVQSAQSVFDENTNVGHV